MITLFFFIIIYIIYIYNFYIVFHNYVYKLSFTVKSNNITFENSKQILNLLKLKIIVNSIAKDWWKELYKSLKRSWNLTLIQLNVLVYLLYNGPASL